MGTKNFSSANDLITFSRASGGTALRKVAYGPELVTNGTFDTDTTGWTAINATLSVVSGALRITKTTVNGQARTSFTTVAGKVYALSADLVGRTTAGSTLIYIGSAAGGTDLGIKSFGVDASGSAYVVFRATTEESHIALYSSAGTGYEDWDNISVKEVLFDQGTLTLLNHPAGIPRIEYDADGNVLGLLVEESRTNLVEYSEDFTNAWWNYSLNVTTTADQAVSPDGRETADKVVATSTNSSHSVGTARGYSSGAANETFSFYVKPAGITNIRVLLANQTGGYTQNFDLSDGTLGASGAGTIAKSIQDVGSGWYRCSMTFTATKTNPYPSVQLLDSDNNATFAGNDSDGIYIWGAQIEAGDFPTSYIPTAGATATRSADFASIPVADFGYNDEAGTFVAEFGYVDPSNGDTNYLLSGGSLARFFYNNTATSAWSIYSGSGISVSGISSDGSSNKAGIAMDDSGTTAYVDGGFAVSNATVKPQGNVSYDFIAIGGIAAGTELNGHIKSIKYYPRRLSNAQLQELTT